MPDQREESIPLAVSAANHTIIASFKEVARYAHHRPITRDAICLWANYVGIRHLTWMNPKDLCLLA